MLLPCSLFLGAGNGGTASIGNLCIVASCLSCLKELYDITYAQIYLCVTQSIQGDVMLNPIEKLKLAILHLNGAWNH